MRTAKTRKKGSTFRADPFLEGWQSNMWQHDKTNKKAYARSEDADQRGHPHSLIRVFTARKMSSLGPTFLHADSEDL